MRESHPYRKVSDWKKRCLQPVCNFFEEYLSLLHCDTQPGWLGVQTSCFSGLKRLFPSPLLVTCPSISHTACRPGSTLAWHFTLSSPLSHFFPHFLLQLCSSSNLPFSRCLLPCSPIPCWISCGLHRFPAPPVSPFFLSRVGGHTWVQYDGSSFIPPLSCLCMSLSVPIVPLLTCPCTTPPHSSFLFPSFMLLL